MDGEIIYLEVPAGGMTEKLGEMEPKRTYLTLKPPTPRAGTGCGST